VSSEKALTIIGIVLSLPGFLVLFLSGQQIIGILVLVIALLLVLNFYRDNFLPAFTILSTSKIITILDLMGKHAAVVLNKKIVPNHRHLQEFVFHHIRADGAVSNFQTNFGLPNAIEKEAGAYKVALRFPKKLKRGKSFEVQLSYDIQDGYLLDKEVTALLGDYPVKELKIEIILPEGRPCLEAHAYQVRGSDLEKEIDNLCISQDRRKVTWEMRKMLPFRTIGFLYKIEWTW